ncbi:LOW QUALITY PROTEIN: hypothetical protein PanWU01x14_041260 [Parasponia andersonii]|uniref:Uncharacterized protein n=1 Tax=Parasponia andersonii TaxID=3476 RepID=A0A2P5DQF1_PARAD|nr:LOW QUALITY PROTEIN: hypothetical protein PanWU01x14_041260 [Parasponia andersonii]
MGLKLLSEIVSSIIHFFRGATAFTHYSPTWPRLSHFLKMSARRLDLTCRVYPELIPWPWTWVSTTSTASLIRFSTWSSTRSERSRPSADDASSHAGSPGRECRHSGPLCYLRRRLFRRLRFPMCPVALSLTSSASSSAAS